MNTQFELVRPRRILSVRERKRLQRDIDLARRDLGGGIGIPEARGKESSDMAMPDRMRRRLESHFYSVAGDPGAVQRIRGAGKALSEGSPDSIGDAERNRLEKVARDFEEWAPKNMATRKMNQLKSKDEGFREAVKAALSEHSPEFTRRAEDYKNAMRQIDPDDESAGDIEKLRPN